MARVYPADLHGLVRSLGWSYAVMWSVSRHSSEMRWIDGWFNTKTPQGLGEQGHVGEPDHTESLVLFHKTYRSRPFASGPGYVPRPLGIAQEQHVWLNQANILRQTLCPDQAHFLQAAGIQTMLCMSWCNIVVEIGTTALVPEDRLVINKIKEIIMAYVSSKERQRHSIRSFRSRDKTAVVAARLVPQDQTEVASRMRVSAPSEGVESNTYFALLERDSSADTLDSRTAAQSGNYVLDGPGYENHKNELQSVVCRHSNALPVASKWGTKISNSPTSILEQTVFTSMPHLSEQAELQASVIMSAAGSGVHEIAPPLTGSSSPISMDYTYKDVYEDLMLPASGDHAQPFDSMNCDANLQLTGQGFHNWRPLCDPMVFQSHEHGRSNHKVFRKCMHLLRHLPQQPERVERQRDEQFQGHGLERTAATPSHDDAAINHMMAERKRRERQKDYFNELRTLIPFVTKVDRASILQDAIKYVKQLQTRVQELEEPNQEFSSSFRQVKKLKSNVSI